jgi:choline kinase
MNAIILAAGRGGRLSGVVGSRPKCLARVGDCSMLERQIASIRRAGLTSITVVTGFGEGDVRCVCERDVTFVHNPHFASTNSLFSLWLARDRFANGFVVFNCDVLFHPAMLDDLLASPHEDALLMCPKDHTVPYSDEEMKVIVRDGCVAAIDKTIAATDADGENVGIVKFGATGAQLLGAELTRLVEAGDVHAWAPRAFAAFARRRPLFIVETAGRPWIEIDDPEDYWRACREVLPAIEQPAAAAGERMLTDTGSHTAAGTAAAARSRRTSRHV